MKKILVLFGIFIALLMVLVGSTLFYPRPAISNSPSEVLYDQDYFITKFAKDNVQLLKGNTFTVTEEELNGYLNLQLENNDVPFNQSGFKATGLKVNLLENRMILDIYGNIYSLPVRLQADLEPFYKEGNIYFTLKGAKFSRINIPERYLSGIIGNSLGMNSGLEKNSQFILPIELHELVIINNVTFQDQHLSIQYQLDQDKLLEELLKEFRSKPNF